MKDTRKELRIRIPDTLRSAFNRAKLKAEQELGMVMTDNEYGRRVLVQKLREMEK
jgi:hypothetical protein